MSPHEDSRYLLNEIEAMTDITEEEQLTIGRIFKQERGSPLTAIWTRILKMALRSALWRLAHPSFNTANGHPIDAETVKSQMLMMAGRVQELELLLKVPDTYADLYDEHEGQKDGPQPPR